MDTVHAVNTVNELTQTAVCIIEGESEHQVSVGIDGQQTIADGNFSVSSVNKRTIDDMNQTSGNMHEGEMMGNSVTAESYVDGNNDNGNEDVKKMRHIQRIEKEVLDQGNDTSTSGVGDCTSKQLQVGYVLRYDIRGSTYFELAL